MDSAIDLSAAAALFVLGFFVTGAMVTTIVAVRFGRRPAVMLLAGGFAALAVLVCAIALPIAPGETSVWIVNRLIVGGSLWLIWLVMGGGALLIGDVLRAKARRRDLVDA